MEFWSLPDNVFLQIFRNLPFEQIVRAGRVNSTFRRMSMTAIGQTKSLDFTTISALLRHRPSSSFTALSMSNLVNICSNNLERIRFGSSLSWTKIELLDHVHSLVEAFLEIPCPRLKVFVCADIDFCGEYVRKLLEHNPNLKTLVVNKHFRVKTNLRLLGVTFLDEFLHYTPNLRKLSINNSSVYYDHDKILFEDIGQLTWFWRLQSLSTLEIRGVNSLGEDYSDDCFIRIAGSFPGLRRLKLPVFYPAITDRGIRALSALPGLHELTLEQLLDCPPELAPAMHNLFWCANLSKVRLVGQICFPSEIVFPLVKTCAHLTSVSFSGDLQHQAFYECATSLPRLLRGDDGGGQFARNRRSSTIVQIRFEALKIHWQYSELDEVKEALKKLEETYRVVVELCKINQQQREENESDDDNETD